MDYDRSEQESLGPQRNDRMVKHAQRQVDYENQGRDPRRSILKESEMNPDAKPSPSMEGFGGIRIDAVVIVVLFIEVLIIEVLCNQADHKWIIKIVTFLYIGSRNRCCWR